MKIKLIAAFAATLSFAPSVSAATVVVTPGSGQRSLTLPTFGPLWQSFTAGASDNILQSFGFQLQTLNPGTANAPVTLTFYAGSGFGGATLGSFTLTPAGVPTTRIPTFVDFLTPGILLTTGQVYTAALTSTSARFGVIYGPDIDLNTGALQGPDAYAGGRFIATNFNDAPCSGGACDANFRYTATAVSAVPETATWGMMIGGFGVIGGALRRRTVRVRYV